jgi:hypothetical protein
MSADDHETAKGDPELERAFAALRAYDARRAPAFAEMRAKANANEASKPPTAVRRIASIGLPLLAAAAGLIIVFKSLAVRISAPAMRGGAALGGDDVQPMQSYAAAKGATVVPAPIDAGSDAQKAQGDSSVPSTSPSRP